MRWISIGLGLGACFAPVPAMAQPACAEFEILGSGASGEYNPFDSSNATDNFDIRVSRLAEGIQSVHFLLLDTAPRSGGPGLGDAGPLDYDILWLEDTSRTVFSANNEMLNATNGATVGLPGRNGVAVTRFRLRIPRGQAAAAGRHVESLTVRYQCLAGSSVSASVASEQIAIVPVEVTVPSYVAAYLGSAGQTRGTIDFGPIGPGEGNLTRSIGVTALSTVPYEVLFESERNGRLRRRPNDDDGIAYRMSFAGTDVDPGSTLVCPSTPVPSGNAQELEVSLRRNSLRDLPAGTYSDTVTLTFQPRDGGNTGSCRLARP